MFCMNCGTKIPDGAKFCMNCGASTGLVDTPSTPDETSGDYIPTSAEAPKKKSIFPEDREDEHGVEHIDPRYLPKCPTCGSSNVEKISAGNKAGSALLFGVFAAGHVSKTYRCKNCGAKW